MPKKIGENFWKSTCPTLPQYSSCRAQDTQIHQKYQSSFPPQWGPLFCWNMNNCPRCNHQALQKKKLFNFIKMRVWQYLMMNPSNNFNWIFYLSLDKFIVLYIGQFRQLKYTLLMIPTSIHSKFRMWK